jgi:hypothetical protein
MTDFKKALILKIISISLIFLLGISSDLYSFSRDYLRIPLDGKWKERTLGVIKQHETAHFNPLKKPISWAGSSLLLPKTEKPVSLDLWEPAHRSPEDDSISKHFRETIDSIFPEEIPYRDIITETLSELEYLPIIKGMKGICYIWSCAACYILKDLPFVEEVKLMRTVDDKQTWLAFKFKNIDKWYAFDRAIGHLVKYAEDYKYGLYKPIEEAEKAAVYFSEQNSYELEYSSDDELMDGVSKSVYIRDALKTLKEDALLSFIKRYDSDGVGLYKGLYGQIRDLDIKLCEHKKEVGISYCCQIIKDIQYWMKKLGPGDPIVIHFCTGDTPWIGYTYLAEFLKDWDKPEVRAILEAHGADPVLKPRIDRIIAYPMDAVFPQKRTEYHSFHNILNNMFDRLGLKKENRRFFYGDLIMNKNGKGCRRMTDKEFNRLAEDIDEKGLLLERDDNTGVSKIIADPKTDALQYRFLKAMEQQALDLSDELREKYGGAHITTGGIGPGYKGNGHFGFNETGDRFDKPAFIAPACYYVRGAHCKEMGGMKKTYVSINGQIKPVYGVVTFSFKDLLFRQDEQDPANGVRTIIIAEGPQKANSLYAGIEEKGPASCEKPMKQIRMTNSLVTIVTEKACASSLNLFEHPWWFKPIKEWTDLQKKQFFIRLAKLRNKKIQDLTADDFLRFGPEENFSPIVEAIRKYNMSTLCKINSWDELKEKVVKDMRENVIRPDEFARKGSKWAKILGLDKEKAKVTYVNPHLDDDYLADKHKIQAMVNAGHEVSVYFLAKGYTAVDDDYAVNIMNYMQNWDSKEFGEILKEDEEKLLYELISIAMARKDYRDPHDYNPWDSMSAREKDIRARLLYINITKRSGLVIDSAEKIKSLSAFLTKANTLKPRGGSRDISLMQDIKVYVRLAEEQAALMSLGVKYENIHAPEDSSWYGAAGRGGTAMEGDVKTVKAILEKENPDLVISNGENFPDYGAHSTTENSVTTALLELLEQGKIKKDVKYMQYAGVWERIKAEESQMGFFLTKGEIEEFERNFIHLYPSQAPPVVPDSHFEDVVHFSTQVRINASASANEIAEVIGTDNINMPEGCGVLNYKIINLEDKDTVAALVKKRNYLEENRDALKAASNENLNGAIPLPDITKMGAEIKSLKKSGLSLADVISVEEFEDQYNNARLPEYREQALAVLNYLNDDNNGGKKKFLKRDKIRSVPNEKRIFINL